MQELLSNGQAKMTDGRRRHILNLEICTAGTYHETMIVLEIRLADVDDFLPLRRDGDQWPEVHVPVPQRGFRAARIPYPPQPDSAAPRRLADQVNGQPRR